MDISSVVLETCSREAQAKISSQTLDIFEEILTIQSLVILLTLITWYVIHVCKEIIFVHATLQKEIMVLGS